MTIFVFLGVAGLHGDRHADRLCIDLCGVALMVTWTSRCADHRDQHHQWCRQFPLMAVPFFMLAGEIMNAGGLSRRIVSFAMALVGHVKGLGYVTVIAGAFSPQYRICVADAAALSALLVPMMVLAGHDKAAPAGL